MRVYKFRKLTNEDELGRLGTILKKGFYCPRFCEMNDPMEGVFNCYGDKDKIVEKINNIFSEKIKYRICSFSGMNGFNNPLLWGYYAGGFKGVAIEIDVQIKNVDEKDESFFKQIVYEESVPDIFTFKNIKDGDAKDIKIIAQKILTTKLNTWKHEDEFRFLIVSDKEEHEIGRITAIYFGNPYSGLDNEKKIKVNKDLADYIERKNKIIAIAKEKQIKCFDVEIVKGKVVPLDENLWSQK